MKETLDNILAELKLSIEETEDLKMRIIRATYANNYSFCICENDFTDGTDLCQECGKERL